MKLPRRPPAWPQLIESVSARTDSQRLFEVALGVGAAPGGKYRHWDTLRHLRPPDGLSHEEWWMGIKLARSSMSKALPFADVTGRPFSYAMPDAVQEMVHRVDQKASGAISVDEVVTNPETTSRYIVSSLIEEAITSSQLEGAVTTQRVAKEMIKSGRPPRDRSERMILNNYEAVRFVADRRRDPLTPELVLRLHELVTQGVLDDPDDAGRLQRPGEERVKVRDPYGEVPHDPPPAEQLPERLEAMCDFANGGLVEGFLHPVVRSILVHFWLAYDHPFADGNGRTARALFYWSTLHHGYWLCEYLSISRILRTAPSRYARSFLYSETDDGDTTYFLLYQLTVLLRAIEELHQYLERKMAEVHRVETLVRSSSEFNHRQLALIGHALRHPDAHYSFRSHATSHGIVYQSARTDLLGLVEKGLLVKQVVGRAHRFVPARDLPDKLQ